MVKLDARTGAKDMNFGTGGAGLIPDNSCKYGSAAALPQYSPQAWPRCKFKALHVKAKAHFKKAKGHRPSLTGTIRLSGVQLDPENLDQTATVKLPKALPLAKGKLRKRVSAKVTTAQRGETTVSVAGRTIKVLFHPKPSGCCEVNPPNGPISIKFGLKPGAMKPIPPRKLHRAMVFKVKAGVTSTRLSPYGVNMDKFYAPSDISSASVRARPVKNRK